MSGTCSAEVLRKSVGLTAVLYVSQCVLCEATEPSTAAGYRQDAHECSVPREALHAPQGVRQQRQEERQKEKGRQEEEEEAVGPRLPAAAGACCPHEIPHLFGTTLHQLCHYFMCTQLPDSIPREPHTPTATPLFVASLWNSPACQAMRLLPPLVRPARVPPLPLALAQGQVRAQRRRLLGWKPLQRGGRSIV